MEPTYELAVRYGTFFVNAIDGNGNKRQLTSGQDLSAVLLDGADRAGRPLSVPLCTAPY